MKEHTAMLIQYVTAAAALVLVALHLVMLTIITPYYTSLSFSHVLQTYKTIVDVGLLELLLVTVVAHGFNGLRIILLEWRQSAMWTRGVNWLSLLVTLAVIGYGTRTVILAAIGTVT